MSLKVLRGLLLPWHIKDDSNLQGVLDLEVRESDVFIISYPKSGTNWLRNIINCMLDCQIEEQNNLSLPIELNICSGPSEEELEASPAVYKLVQSWTSPRVVFTHLLPYLLPTQLFEKKAKILYIARNPKDVAVSFYFFVNALKSGTPQTRWDEFVTSFMQGEVSYGSYFDHVKQYWEMKEQLLFVKFEDLKKNEKAVIKQVGTFLGRELDDQKISDIAEQCSIPSMRKKFKETSQAMSMIIDETKTEFIRKGKVGNWRELMTVAQSERFDQLYEEHLGDTGLTFDFE